MRFSKGAGGQGTVTRSEPRPVEISPSEDAALREVIVKLVTFLNTEDRDGYMSLFSARLVRKRQAEADPLEAILTFMAGAKEQRGGIVRLHELARTGYAIGESPYPMRPVRFHLEDGTPGYLGISLDPDRKIDHLSLFVHEGVCPNGSACTSARPIAEFAAAP
jgi:hypothetical protein